MRLLLFDRPDLTDTNVAPQTAWRASENPGPHPGLPPGRAGAVTHTSAQAGARPRRVGGLRARPWRTGLNRRRGPRPPTPEKGEGVVEYDSRSWCYRSSTWTRPRT